MQEGPGFNGALFRLTTPAGFLVLAAILATLSFACRAVPGPSASLPTNASGDDTASEETERHSLVTRPDRNYSIEDVAAAGWKKSKEFDAAALPHAIVVQFGFFQQKDIEVWVYGSHADALEFGVPIAEQAVARKPGQTDYLIPVVTRYYAYAVVGNLVVLCERELAVCESLVAGLP